MKEIRPESHWKRIARNVFFLLSVASVIPLALAAYFEIQAHKVGTKQPTAEKPVGSIQHGDKKYITLDEAERIRLMWMLFIFGFPSVIVLGFALRFGFGVNILKQEPMPRWVEQLMNKLKKEPR